jgi:hypothetical protein
VPNDYLGSQLVPTTEGEDTVSETYIPIELYLHSPCKPDRDYVDGELEDRNVGLYSHRIVRRGAVVPSKQAWMEDSLCDVKLDEEGIQRLYQQLSYFAQREIEAGAVNGKCLR